MQDGFISTYGLAVAVAVVFLYALKLTSIKQRSLDRIPTVGPSAPLLCYIGVFRFLFNARGMVQEGYAKYKGSAFKVPRVDRWLIVVSGPKLMEEFRTAPDDILSFEEATNDTLAIAYTLGPNIRHNEYHIPIIRSQLTRSLSSVVPEMFEEAAIAFYDEIPFKATEWTSVPCLDTVMKIVARTSNRAFVGVPLCRDPDYRDLNVGFTMDVAKGAALINLFPAFLKPIVGNFLTRVPSSINRGVKHLAPVIQERLRKMEELGDKWHDKPKDLITWLIEEAQDEERSVRNWALRVLTVNFAAIHTSSTSFSHALFHLAANPQYIQPLREEVEAAVKEEGWTRAALQKMRKVDSFLRESMRYSGLGCLSMSRKAIKGFTFSDGTYVPAGVYVSAAATAAHHDEEYYPNADVFDGFRFVNVSEGGEESSKQPLITTGYDFVIFGHGKHSCPGRFFAAAVMKVMMAHMVVTYDVKMQNEGIRPPDFWFGPASSPNRKAEVMFRKRQI